MARPLSNYMNENKNVEKLVSNGAQLVYHRISLKEVAQIETAS